MTRPNPDRPDLTPEDAAFVKRVADLHSPPRLSPVEQSAFDSRLKERLSRPPRGHWRPVLVGAAAVVALAILLLRAGEAPPPGSGPERIAAKPAVPGSARVETTAEDAILALTAANAASSEEDLPEDYEAIQDLFLGG